MVVVTSNYSIKFSQDEYDKLIELANRHDITKTMVIRRALQLLYKLDTATKENSKIIIVGKDDKPIQLEILL